MHSFQHKYSRNSCTETQHTRARTERSSEQTAWSQASDTGNGIGEVKKTTGSMNEDWRTNKQQSRTAEEKDSVDGVATCSTEADEQSQSE